MKMPFGKYKDWEIKNIPTSYLNWIISELRELDYQVITKEIKDELIFRSKSTAGQTTKLAKPVLAEKLYPLLRQMPDEMYGTTHVLGEFLLTVVKRASNE